MFQGEVIPINVQLCFAAILEGSEEDFFDDKGLDFTRYDALNLSGAIFLRVSALKNLIFSCCGIFQGDILCLELSIQDSNFRIDNQLSHLFCKVVEHNGGGQTIDELGGEYVLHFLVHY